MSISIICYKSKNIIYLNLGDIINPEDGIIQLNKLNELVLESDNKALILVNAKKFMPGRNFMEIASQTLYKRSPNIIKAAYIGIENYNKKLYDQYDKFNMKKVNRKNFDDEESALLWLIE